MNITVRIYNFILNIILLIAILLLFGQTCLPGYGVKCFYEMKGWTFRTPTKIPKRLVAVSIETCKADSLLLYSYLSQLNSTNHYLVAKRECFCELWWLRCMMYVNREKNINFVTKSSFYLRGKDNFAFGIFPEGMCKKTYKWRSGFYYIAKKTGADIGIIGIDHDKKEISLDYIFKPSNDYDKDLKQIKKKLYKYIPARQQNCSLFD